MKKLLIYFLVVICFPVFTNAQTMEVVETPKKIYISGTSFDYSEDHCYGADCYFQTPFLSSITDYMRKNLRYPVVCEENGIQGDVYISFFIERDGGISNVNLVQGRDPALDKEAIRFVNNMPRWNPGKIEGKIVRTKYTIRIGFRLN